MADHGTVEYATATGNDYPAHEASYESFMQFTFVGIIHVITILFGLGDRRRHGPLVSGAADFIIARARRRSPACQRLEDPSYVAFVLCFLIFAFTGLSLALDGVLGRNAEARMRIAVARETDAAEPRVAATPETVKKLKALGAEVAVARGAGIASGIPDAEFEAAGAQDRRRRHQGCRRGAESAAAGAERTRRLQEGRAGHRHHGSLRQRGRAQADGRRRALPPSPWS